MSRAEKIGKVLCSQASFKFLGGKSILGEEIQFPISMMSLHEAYQTSFFLLESCYIHFVQLVTFPTSIALVTTH